MENATFDSPPIIPLVSALELAEKHSDETPKKPGNEWITDFFGKLSGRGADKN